MSGYVVKNFERGLWTVGHYQPDGTFDPEADYTDQVAAGQRCHFLNGGNSADLVAQLADVQAKLSEARDRLVFNDGDRIRYRAALCRIEGLRRNSRDGGAPEVIAREALEPQS